jgi:hypothetical protein
MTPNQDPGSMVRTHPGDSRVSRAALPRTPCLSLSPSPLFFRSSNSSSASVFSPPVANVSGVSSPSIPPPTFHHNVPDQNDFDDIKSSPIGLPPGDPPPDNLYWLDEIFGDYHNPSTNDHGSPLLTSEHPLSMSKHSPDFNENNCQWSGVLSEKHFDRVIHATLIARCYVSRWVRPVLPPLTTVVMNATLLMHLPMRFLSSK